MEYSRIICKVDGPAALITLNRPDVHNAFDEFVIGEMTDVITLLQSEPSVRAIVIAGSGKSFCAGADLEWMKRMAAYTYAENLEDAWGLQRMFAAIAHSTKVTIARVHGAAIGGGAGLVAVCDVAIAAPEATFALSEVRLGLIPAVVGSYVLGRGGVGAARAPFVNGGRVGAEHALRIGLVNKIVEANDLDSEVEKTVKLVSEAGPHAIETAKSLLRQIQGKSPGDVAELTAETIARLRAGDEGKEGIRAFLEKRKPNF